MASLLDLFKQPEKSDNPIVNFIANTSPVGRLVTNVFQSKPVQTQVKKVQTTGNRVLTDIGKTSISPQLQTFGNAINSVRTTQNPLFQLPQQFAGGIVQGSNLGVGGAPSIQPRTIPQNLAFAAGNITGSLNPYSLSGKFFRGASEATNPILSKITGSAGQFVNPRVAGAGSNVLQGLAINRTLGQPNTPTSIAFDALTGLAMGPNQFDTFNTKELSTGTLPKIKVKPEEVVDKRQTILNLAKAKEFGFRTNSGKGEINTNALEVIDKLHAQIFGLPERSKTLRQLDYGQKVDDLVEALNGYTIQLDMKNAGVKMGIQDQNVAQPPVGNINKKYAFNINKERLGLKGEPAKQLDTVVKEMKPILQKNKGTPLTNKQIIEGGRKANMLSQVMTKQESADFSKSLQASRNFLRTEAQKPGLTPQFLQQLEIVSSQAADKGRALRAFAVGAEDATIKESVIKDLQKLGVEANDLLNGAKNVDWNDAKQVTEFYRKYKPAKLAEKLEEFRYTNMLSSPNTHINNTFSNLLQTAVAAPVEKTVTGGLDFVRSRLTGAEQKYFASQGVDYAKGYWKSLPEAWTNFKKVMSGEQSLMKPDIEGIPTGTGKIHQLYTTPLRMLEGSDQFFKTLTVGGEKEALKRSGLSEAQILQKASDTAEYRLFRQAFDPEGKLGQGGLLKVWDKWNAGVNSLRRLPGGKWLVPFLQTPTNILKQGVEYSPLGIATVPGSKEPIVQLAKTMMGTSLFMAAYSMAESGLTTWDAPTSSKEREKYYAAGIQPYSVKIGNNWVSYSKLGPLSYPIAMAASMKWAKDNGASDDFLTNAATGAGGFLQFFADQSYMQGIGDIIDAVRGDEFKQGRALANIPSQMIPYRALQGWIARLVDPVYRKSTGGGVAQQATKSIFTQIPVLSKSLEPYTTPTGEPSPRQFPVTNAFSPFKITQETGTYTPKVKITKSEPIKIGKAFEAQAAEDIPLPKQEDKVKILFKDALSTARGYEDKVLKVQQDDTLDADQRQSKLDTLQKNFDSSVHMLNKIKTQQPEKIFNFLVDSYDKNSSSPIADRADWAAEQLKSGVDIQKLYDGQVLTKSVVEALNDKYGLNLDKYNYGDGFRYLTKSSGGTSKKITVKKTTISPIKLSAPKTNLAGVKIKAPPKIKSNFKFIQPPSSSKGAIKIKPITVKVSKL